MAFTNRHLSYSRIERYEQCPLSFKLHYVDREPADAGTEPLFGKVVHQTLERLVGEHRRDWLGAAPLPEDRAIALWQEQWTASALVGAGLFEEGAQMLKAFCRSEGPVDPANVLGVEHPFELSIGRFRVVGAIDRADRVGERAVRVRDYKTNRILFPRTEVDTSLQLSIYAIAAQTLWPWAERVELQLDMLRHDVRLRTSRTPEQLEAVRRYIESQYGRPFRSC